MAASKSGTTSSEAQSASNSNKPIENSLIKHQGQKWQQFYDFDKMLKQIRVAEKQHYRSSSKVDSSSSHNNGKSSSSSSHGSSSSSSKSSSTSSSRNGRSIRQVQRLCGNDMHYYGIIPKHTSSDVIVCSACRGSYTKVGFNNHMMMQHPAAWGAASSKLSHTISTNEVYNLISNDNSQDCIRDVSSATTAASHELLGSPSDLSGIMSTSSNASSSSSLSTSTSSNTYTATTGRHKSSKSSGTTGGNSSSGSSSSRSRSKQSRHSSSNNNIHATSIGIHTSSSTAIAETTQTPSKSSKKSSSSTNSSTSSSSTSSSTNSNKNDNKNNNTAALAATSTLTVTTTNVVSNATSASKHSKETTTTASLLETTTTTATVTTNPIALYSSSSNSSCSLPPTPKLSTTLAEVKSPTVALQELADSSVSSSSADYERANLIGKTSSKATHTPTTTVKANTSTASTYSSSSTLAIGKEVPNISTVKEIAHFDAQQLSELDQAVSSITDGTNVEASSTLCNKKTTGSNKTIIDTTTNIMTTTPNNMFQIPTTINTITETNNEKLQEAIVTPIAPSNNMNVAPPVMSTTNYVVPQEVVQACENALTHNTSDDNSILTFDDVFDSKFINEILSTADTEIHFDENELDTVSVVQQQQQQQLDNNQMYQQQQQVPAIKRMRYDETILDSGTTVGQQQQQNGMPGVEITGEFVAYQQHTQLQQHQQQYMPYNVTSLDDLKMFNTAGTMLEQHQQQMPTHLQQQQQHQQHVNEHQQQQLTAIDAMQLQQLLYQQQTLNTHFDNTGGMINDGTSLQHHQQQQQQSYDGSSGVVSAKQLLDMCGATVDMKTNKMSDFTLSTAASGGGGYESVDGGVGTYKHTTANFQLYNVPSLTDDNVPNGEERGGHLTVNDGVCETTNIMMPNIMNGMQQQQQRGCAQQFVLPGGVVGSGAEEQLIYEITDNNQVAVISQQRQQQMLNEFLTQANYEQQKLDMNSNAGVALDISTNTGILLQQPNKSNNENNISDKETVDDIDADILDFDYALLDTVKGFSSSSSSSSSNSNVKAIKTEFSTSGGSSSSGSSATISNSKSYEDVYLNTYLYAGIPKPTAINCFGLIKLPFAAATTFRKHILNTRKANNSPITLSGGGGINGIVCGNSATTARNSSKSMQNYFSNLTSSSSSNNALASGNGNEFSIGSITITNSTVSQQSQLFAAQQKQQSNGGNSGSNASNSGGIEITFNTNSNGCGSASMSPVSSSASVQRSRSKSGNNSTSGSGGAAGGATLVRSKSQTGAPVAVITPTNRLPLPPPRPSTAGPVLAQSSKTIFVSNTGMSGNSNDRVKFIKRCMPLVSSSNNNSRSEGGSKRPKFSPRQIADLLGGVSVSSGHSINNKSAANHKTVATTDVTINGISSNHEVNNPNANNNSSNSNPITNSNNVTSNSDSEQLKSERVARFYERRRKLYDMARNTRQQQQHQQQQRTQPPQLQQKLLKQQQQLFKMLTDYGQLNAPTPTPVVGNCKGANAKANGGNNNNSNGSEILRISV